MSDIASNMAGALQELGGSFLVAYYLPAVVFLMVNVQILAPVWLSLAADVSTPAATVTIPADEAAPVAPLLHENVPGLVALIDGLDTQLAEIVSAVFVPFLIGLILLALNDVLIRGFEGKLPWLRYGLLLPWQRRNERRCRERYGALEELQAEYRRVSGELWRAQTEAEQVRLAQLQAGLAQQINEEHDRIEQVRDGAILPHAVYRVAPTTFGNVYALAEEYPYERYGIDAVLFWPRLRTLMQDHAQAHSSRISYAKSYLDLSINFAFLAWIIFVEAAATWIWGWLHGEPLWQPVLLAVTLTALFLGIGFYTASIGRVAILGELIKSSYEQYRHLILDAFQLRQPVALAEEQILWVQLAAFIRRGDEFYFPAGFRVQQNDSPTQEG